VSSPVPNQTSSRRVCFVVGPGRSGTSAVAGALQALRMRVPGAEVPAGPANPNGSAESRWVVDLHSELLDRANVVVDDARPSAWFETGKWAANGMPRARATEWLGQQFAPEPDDEVEPELVIKDPRLTWFLGLWKAAAMRCAATPVFLMPLRDPASVVSSLVPSLVPSAADPTAALAGWLNLALHTEKATRGSVRAFVSYDDLLSDWTLPIFRAGADLGLRSVAEASANDMRRVHQFLDAGLPGDPTAWADLAVPAALRDLADRAWAELAPLAGPGGDTTERQGALDAVRDEYVGLYEEAERITAATAAAAARAAVRPSGQLDGESSDEAAGGRGLKRLLGR
jgi:hypothetical protein